MHLHSLNVIMVALLMPVVHVHEPREGGVGRYTQKKHGGISGWEGISFGNLEIIRIRRNGLRDNW